MAFNQLSDAEAERLAVLSEECGEVVHAIGKIQRHGYDSRHPDGGPSNREALEFEMGHIHFIMRLMIQNNDLNITSICKSMAKKSFKINKYLHHQ